MTRVVLGRDGCLHRGSLIQDEDPGGYYSRGRESDRGENRSTREVAPATCSGSRSSRARLSGEWLRREVPEATLELATRPFVGEEFPQLVVVRERVENALILECRPEELPPLLVGQVPEEDSISQLTDFVLSQSTPRDLARPARNCSLNS